MIMMAKRYSENQVGLKISGMLSPIVASISAQQMSNRYLASIHVLWSIIDIVDIRIIFTFKSTKHILVYCRPGP